MINRSWKIFCDSAVAFSLLIAFVGCAQNRANIKAVQSVEENGTAVIQAINSSSDGVQIEVLTEKPLSYTYYKTSEPPKIVVDLAQIEPGSVENQMELNSGNIKRIEVTRHDFTGGFLSRVEIMLIQDKDDFTVATDSTDKGKLLINFPQTTTETVPDSVTKEETSPAALLLSENSAESQHVEEQVVGSNEKSIKYGDPPSTQQLQTEKIVDHESPAVTGNLLEEKKSDSLSSKPNEGKLLHSVYASDDGVEINVSGGIETYNVFKLTKPDRIVLDLPGVKSGLAAKAIAINKFDVGQVRQGIYPDKIRIVLDAEKSKLLPYQVVKVAGGLKVVFVGVSELESVSVKANVPVSKTTVGRKHTTNQAPSIEAIDFKIVEDISRIEIKTSGDCKAVDPIKVSGGLSLTIKNCQIPMKLQRMIDTSSFQSVVNMITPYQVKMKRGNDARILVKLRQPTSSVLTKEGETLIWDIKNPENYKSTIIIAKQDKATSEVNEKMVASPLNDTGENVVQNMKVKAIDVINPDSEPKFGAKKVYTGRRVSLEFSDADIRKILQLIAEVSNLNFLIGDDVSGTISIKLVNVPWDQALDVILDSKGLEMRRDGNIMYVKPKGKFKTEEQEEAEAKSERERRMELKTRVFDISFADISDIAKQFDKLKSERGTIAQDERTNRVIVTDIENRLEKMRSLLKELDLPEKQVMIEARIVEASSNFTRDLGVQWGIHYKDGSASFLGINKLDVGLGGIVTPPPSTGTFGVTSAGSAAGISFGKLASSVQLDLRLSAAATIGQVKVISSPKVITLNNKSAKISQGQSIPYQTTSAEGTKTEFIEAALTLEVTPHIAADGTISMKIKATNNSAGSGTPPPINKKEATTEVQVMNGETTVIGGIYQDSDTETDTGVPYLQSIPLLGWLFKSNQKIKTKTELLIFITPKIVN